MMRFVLGVVFGVGCSLYAAETKPLYENNLEKADVDKVPEDMLVLDGAFAVKQDGGNKFLQLPGAPVVEGSGVLFGPTEKDGVVVSARIHATGKGRRFPSFGVGLNGVGGCRLQVSAAKKLIELLKGDEVVESVPYTWESDSWTMLRLQLRKVKEGEWMAQGKVWKQGAAEPKEWTISHPEKAEPAAGRASIWGTPLSGTPIQFDDLRVTAQ
jgi:hypothetical protein